MNNEMAAFLCFIVLYFAIAIILCFVAGFLFSCDDADDFIMAALLWPVSLVILVVGHAVVFACRFGGFVRCKLKKQ